MDVYEKELLLENEAFRYVMADERGRRVLGSLLAYMGLFKAADAGSAPRQAAAVGLLNNMMAVDGDMAVKVVTETLHRSVDLNKKLEQEEKEKENKQ